MKELLITPSLPNYELLDSGEGEKLERYGQYILCRPDPQVLWPKSQSLEEWKKADATFIRLEKSGKWHISTEIKEPWKIFFGTLSFMLKLLPSKHLGVFPEQYGHWKWLGEKIKKEKRQISVLNLFAYTGGASLACAEAGATVCHVDASKFVVDAAHSNLIASGLGKAHVRFIVDDVRKFVEREIKRGNKYDIILLDPPVYGKGNGGEVWNIDVDLMPLLLRIKSLLSPDPIAIVLNGYASNYSSTTYEQMLGEITKDSNGTLSSGELCIKESSSGRLLTCGIFARFEN